MSRAPRPGRRRLGRAGAAAVAILLVLVIFVGRNLWHASEVAEPPPEIDATARP